MKPMRFGSYKMLVDRVGRLSFSDGLLQIFRSLENECRNNSMKEDEEACCVQALPTDVVPK